MNNPANSSLRYMTAVVTLPNWHKKDWKKVRKNISELLKHARFVYRTPLNSGMYAIKCSRLANKSHLISSTKQANVRWEIVLCGLPATRKRGLDVALPLDNKIITTIAKPSDDEDGRSLPPHRRYWSLVKRNDRYNHHSTSGDDGGRSPSLDHRHGSPFRHRSFPEKELDDITLRLCNLVLISLAIWKFVLFNISFRFLINEKFLWLIDI